MKVNLYDFDKTIYYGDSSVNFYKYCLKKINEESKGSKKEESKGTKKKEKNMSK